MPILWNIYGLWYISWTRLRNKLAQRYAFRMTLQKLLTAGMVGGEGAPSLIRMGIDLPAAGEKTVPPMVLNEALHILQWVTQEQPDLVGKAGGVHQAGAKMM